ncbi:MAG: NADP-dependent oxidoreductase [Thermomicrobiales bacterium]
MTEATSLIAPANAATTIARAAIQYTFGGPTALAIETVTIPAPAAGQVLVKSRAAGINPVDLKMTQGGGIAGMLPAGTVEAGLTLGWDLAGDVVATGEGVTAFQPGDRVFGLIAFPNLGRTFADHVLVDAADIVAIPETVSDIASGAIPLVGLTAWQALFDVAKLTAGQTLLLHGGTGGVGHIAIQLAKHAGAHVIVTASAKNRDYLSGLGADEVIDYRTQRFEELVPNVDVVFNTVMGDALDRSWQVLKPGGIIVSILATPVVPEGAPDGVRGQHVFVNHNGAEMAELATLMADGSLVPTIARTGSLDDLPSLLEELDGGRTIGKLVVTF